MAFLRLKRVLAADDSVMMCWAIKDVLTRDPQTSAVEVVVVDNGTDVFERLRAESFDLLISDVNMPGMPIVDVLRQIEDDPKLAKMPVVIMSSVGLDEPIERTGPLAFVRKPEMKVSLIQAVRKVMAGKTELSDAPEVVRTPVPSVLDAATVRIFTEFASQNIRVLVVDDSATTRKVTTRLLKIMRVDVDSAADGEEAIRKLEASRFHLVLMDVDMPGIDGLEATRILRAAEPMPQHTTVLAYTAGGSLTDCDAAGMDGHIPKRVTLGELRKSLTEWISKIQPDQDVRKAS